MDESEMKNSVEGFYTVSQLLSGTGLFPERDHCGGIQSLNLFVHIQTFYNLFLTL